MLWTLGGLLLLVGLGIVIGACWALPVAGPEGKAGGIFLLILIAAATYGVTRLIVEWLWPIGGGG